MMPAFTEQNLPGGHHNDESQAVAKQAKAIKLVAGTKRAFLRGLLFFTANLNSRTSIRGSGAH